MPPEKKAKGRPPGQENGPTEIATDSIAGLAARQLRRRGVRAGWTCGACSRPQRLHATDPGPVPRGPVDAPLTPVQLCPPGRRRHQWWYTYQCLVCGDPQFGRARERHDVPGVRRAGCGHRLEVVVANTLGGDQ